MRLIQSKAKPERYFLACEASALRKEEGNTLRIRRRDRGNMGVAPKILAGD
jgi:hypothetical protein